MEVLGYLNRVHHGGTEVRATVMLVDYDPATKNHPRRIACSDGLFVDPTRSSAVHGTRPYYTTTAHGPGRLSLDKSNLPIHSNEDVAGAPACLPAHPRACLPACLRRLGVVRNLPRPQHARSPLWCLS